MGPIRALVTGAASGIGAAVCERMQADGALVAGLDRQAIDATALHDTRTCELTDEHALAVAVDAAAGALGGLDVVVNAAGIAAPGSVTDVSTAVWDEGFAVNVRAPFLVARQAVPFLRAGGRGTIVNIGSQLGIAAVAGSAAYCASKAAVHQLTRAMAVDLAPDITVNAIAPGPTQTPMLERSFERTDDPVHARHESRSKLLTERFVDPAEIAAAVAYLAGGEARSVTGECLVVDGGYVVR